VGVGRCGIGEKGAVELPVVFVVLWGLVVLGCLEELGDAVVPTVVFYAFDTLVPGEELGVGRG
jgi:hypothetical protein